MEGVAEEYHKKITRRDFTRLKKTYTLLNIRPSGLGLGEEDRVPEQERLRRIFEHYDANHDSILDRGELRAMLHDMYERAIDEAESDGASAAWVKLAREQLTTPWGDACVDEATQELLSLRDEAGTGTLTFDEFTRALSKEKLRHRQKNSFWKLAPVILPSWPPGHAFLCVYPIA